MAMTAHATDGQRILVTAASLWFLDISKILSKEFRPQGKIQRLPQKSAVVEKSMDCLPEWIHKRPAQQSTRK